MIEIRGRKFRDHLHLYEEYEKELAGKQPKPAPSKPEPESEDHTIQRERSEALSSAHEPTDERQHEAALGLFGRKAWSDWKNFK